jgi:bla regulator protein BlaR1
MADVVTTIIETERGPKKVDKVDYPFVMDENILGKWEFADYVETPASFVAGATSFGDDPYLKAIEFLDNGKVIVTIGVDEPFVSAFMWTAERIMNMAESTCSLYTITAVNGDTYMMFDWKSADYSYNNLVPYYYVFKKII